MAEHLAIDAAQRLIQVTSEALRSRSVDDVRASPLSPRVWSSGTSILEVFSMPRQYAKL